MQNSVAITKAETLQPKPGDAKTIFGFWVYIMTDCILFATLFATYAVLHNNTFGGPSAKTLFDLPFVLAETLILLTSSFTCGLAVLASHKNKMKKAINWFLVTFFLGLSFLSLEIYEFRHLILSGNGPDRSAFLSAFFTLVATHGLHITVGLIWITVLIGQMLARGMNGDSLRRQSCFSLFWHFLDIVWIFIFTIVYLMGVL